MELDELEVGVLESDDTLNEGDADCAMLEELLSEDCTAEELGEFEELLEIVDEDMIGSLDDVRVSDAIEETVEEPLDEAGGAAANALADELAEEDTTVETADELTTVSTVEEDTTLEELLLGVDIGVEDTTGSLDDELPTLDNELDELTTATSATGLANEELVAYDEEDRLGVGVDVGVGVGVGVGVNDTAESLGETAMEDDMLDEMTIARLA